MVLRRIKLDWAVKVLCVIVTLCVGYHLLGFTARPHVGHTNMKTNELKPRTKAGRHLDTNKKALLASQTKNFEPFSTKTRRNLVIASHGRSGSSLMGDIFNHHPSVFYMYEPLAPQRVLANSAFRNPSYSGLVEQFLTGVFRCKFDHPKILGDIGRYYRRRDHTRISQAMSSPPLCPYKRTDPRWDSKICPPITSESLESACKDNYNLTVIKVLLSRIPENSIKTVLNTYNRMADVDCKVVFLVRDPRAVISSSRLMGFYKELDDKQGTRIYSNKECKQTENNLEFVRRLPDSLRDRIKLQRFEDLAMNLLKELSGLFEFAGLPVLENVRLWLNTTTHLSRKDCNPAIDGKPVTCTKDDAWSAANRWRWRVHPNEIDIIEYYCGNVMRLLGYRPVNRSHEVLANVKIPLFSDEYEAKQWFLH